MLRTVGLEERLPKAARELLIESCPLENRPMKASDLMSGVLGWCLHRVSVWESRGGKAGCEQR